MKCRDAAVKLDVWKLRARKGVVRVEVTGAAGCVVERVPCERGEVRQVVADDQGRRSGCRETRGRVVLKKDEFMHGDAAAGNSQDAYNTRSPYAIGSRHRRVKRSLRVSPPKPSTRPLTWGPRLLEIRPLRTQVSYYSIRPRRTLRVLHSQSRGQPYKVTQWWYAMLKANSTSCTSFHNFPNHTYTNLSRAPPVHLKSSIFSKLDVTCLRRVCTRLLLSL